MLLLGVVFWLGTAAVQSGVFGEKAERALSFNPLLTDGHGHTNILLLGVAGEAEEGGNLTDSIMVVSINPEVPSISMLSLPRDLFVSSQIGDRKINEIYASARYHHGDQKGLEIIEDAVSSFTGIDIHYAAVVDFDIFSSSVDLLGGVDIFVPEDIVDPFYPDGRYGYETFVVRKGLQHLDGAMALQYARSRKTSSDYSRAKRQQDLALAIRRKIEANGWIENIEKIREFYDLFSRSINTDISLKEIVALAKIGLSVDFGNSVSAVLSDDPTQMGGFLYTPAQEFYGGQFVLLPESLADTQTFMELVLITPEILLENAQISVLNGTGVSGHAGDTASRLRRIGFHVIDVGNYDATPPVARTFLRVLNDTKAETFEFFRDFYRSERVEVLDLETIDPDNLVDLEIVLGTD
ncbi:LCP family protein [bacterium]|nr:LCP family protein [bacterium]